MTVAHAHEDLDAGAAAPAHDHCDSQETPDCSSESVSSASAAKSPCCQLDRRVAPDGLTPDVEHEACRKQVTLKLECETASEARLLVGSLRTVIALGAALLCAEVILKYTSNRNSYFRRRRFAIFNVTLASVCLLAMTCALVNYIRHVRLVRQQVWTQRRVRLTSAYAAMLVIQMINVIFWIVPSAALLHSQCYWYSHFVDTCGFIRWTCWNTLFAILSIMTHCCCPQRTQLRRGRLWHWLRRRQLEQPQQSSGEEDVDLGDAQQTSPVIEQGATSLDTFAGGRDSRIILDSPFWVHWPSAIVWSILEADLIWQRISTSHIKPVGDCDNFARACYSIAILVNSGGLAARLIATFFMGYSLLFIYYSTRTFRALRRSPYHLFRVGSMIARIQRNTTRSIVLFLFLGAGLLWFSGDTFCSSYLMAWFGLAPNQLAMTGLVVVLSILFMPRSATDLEPLRKVLLQQIAWDEGSRMRKRGVLKSATARHAGLRDLEHSPLFCLETALKAFHFSFLSYRYEEHAGADVEAAETDDDPDALEGMVPLDTRMGPALQLFGLSSLEIMREATHDTKLVLGSGPGVIVLAFRGTSSIAAARVDLQDFVSAMLQVLLAKHPRQPGEASRRWPAMVHKGFLLAWTSGGLRRRVLERVRQLLEQCRKGSLPRILLCGHSLGGALAGLAAYDIQCEFNLPPGLAEVYTFGSPRLGNSTFTTDYNRRLPETWHIINEKDSITQVGKFKVYKRTGASAIIDATGDICVRPAPLERRLHFGGEYFAVEMLLVPLVCNLWRASQRLKHHFLSEYGFSLMMVMAAQFTCKGIAGGAQGVADMLSRERDDTVRPILETGGFRLEEVMRGSGYSLEADEQTVTFAALPSSGTASVDALANVRKLGARKWRRDKKGRRSGEVSFGNAESASEQPKKWTVSRILMSPFVLVSQMFRCEE